MSAHSGRPRSWLAVAIMLIGFLVGGLALVFGPSWVLFWVGVAVVAGGGAVGLAVGIFQDVVMDDPRVTP